jgi:signal transduction histidine kinase
MQLVKYKYAQDLLIPFSEYLLKYKLDEISAFQLKIAYEYDIPLLEKLKGVPQEQLLQLTKTGYIEFLEYWKAGNAEGLINDSLVKWNQDELGIVGKFDIAVEDITYINDLRYRSFAEFIPSFTPDVQTQEKLKEQIRQFLLISTTSGVAGYITILKQQLSKRETQLLEAQALAKVGSFDWDLVKDVSDHTPELRKIFGELRNGYKNWMDDVHPEDRERVKEAIAQSFVTGKFDAEYRYRTPAQEKVLWSKGEVLFNAEGKPVMMRGTVQDITEWKKIVSDLQESIHAQAQLKLLNLYKDEFLNIASHELKTPLTSIKAFLQLTLTVEKEPEPINFIQKSLLHVKKLEKLIADLLDTSKLNAGKLIYNMTIFDISSLVRDIALQFEQNYKDRKIIHSHTAPVMVYGDAMRIEQVINNLVDNALKYSKEEVIVSIEPQGDNVCIHIIDKGIGIPQEEMKHLFHRFYRSNTVSMAYQGMGLGLYISDKIMKQHNGYINVESELNKGSKFTICLPILLPEDVAG